MIQTIKTAVFPVAGLGTRFLPVTKSSPKEMLPIIDRPLIQYAVDEALAAGIEHLVFITKNSKHSLEDYFDSNYELESRLEKSGQDHKLSLIKNIIPARTKVTYIRQREPKGLGDAILQARHVVGNQAFAVLLADDLMVSDKPCIQSMIKTYEKRKGSVVAIQSKPDEELYKYGVVGLKKGSFDIEKIVEKPKSKKLAPSNLAVIGRYILTPTIFDFLEQTEAGVNGEIQVTDAIARLISIEPVVAYHYLGNRFDCGEPQGYLEATIHQAMIRCDLKDSFKQYIIKQFL